MKQVSSTSICVGQSVYLCAACCFCFFICIIPAEIYFSFSLIGKAIYYSSCRSLQERQVCSIISQMYLSHLHFIFDLARSSPPPIIEWVSILVSPRKGETVEDNSTKHNWYISPLSLPIHILNCSIAKILIFSPLTILL